MTKKGVSSHISTRCLQCGKSANLIQKMQNIALFGPILMQTLTCAHCGFKWSDAMSLEFKRPMGFEAKIDGEKELRTKIVRNSSGTVEIPELGVLIEPGPFAEGFFTNMEGLLERVESVLELLAKSEDKKQANGAKATLKKLQKCKDGKMEFTVRVLDPLGGSALIGEKVKHWKLSQIEAGKLEKGISLS